MRLTASVVCVSLFGAALGAQAPGNASAAGEGVQGVKVLLLPPARHAPLRFVLSEPAYVAAFIVYPGAGVRLLYPVVDASEQLHTAGYNIEQLFGDQFDDASYRAVIGTTFTGPAYLYVIASRNPLDVGRYVHRPMRLASSVGTVASRSFYAHVAFDALLNNAVALGDDASWDSDVRVLWPGTGGTAAGRADVPRLQYSTLSCGDGSSRPVPLNYPFSGCQGDSHLRVNAQATVQSQQLRTAVASTQIENATLASRASNEKPTVLPTIIGTRVSDADRRVEIEKEHASERTYFTAANGSDGSAPNAAATGGQTDVELVGIGMARERGRGAEALAAERHKSSRSQHDGEVVGGNPRLSPAPRLSPNPVLAPAPNVGRQSSGSQAPDIRSAAKGSQSSTAGQPSSGGHIQ